MILAIDCSNGLNILIFSNKKIIVIKKYKNIKNISEILINKIELALKKINVSYNQIKKVIIINGPGSFTGIRSSITFAKMLGLSLSIPIYGFSKFEIINFLYQGEIKKYKTIFLYYSSNQFYRCRFDKKNKQISDPELVELVKNEDLVNIEEFEHIIADNDKIFEFIDLSSVRKKYLNIDIFNFNIDNLVNISDNYFQKKFIPKPIYVKNFY